MKAVIMAGGQGTRFRPFTFSIPKPLLPVGEKPILELIIRRLHSLNINEVVLAIGYGAELIKAYFNNGEKFNVNIKYIQETKALGTAGPLRLIKGLKEPFMVMNGDILTKLNFLDMLAYHKKNGAEITVAVKKYTNQLPFGTLAISGQQILDIKEKPVTKHFISTGIYIIQPRVLKLIPPDTFFTMPDLLKALIKAGKKVIKYEFEEYWLAIEQMEQLKEASANIKEWIEY